MFYYILRKDGAYAGVILWSGKGDHRPRYVVNDGTKRYENAKYLFEGQAKDWPPTPQVPK